jgi:hypothetical protein
LGGYWGITVIVPSYIIAGKLLTLIIYLRGGRSVSLLRSKLDLKFRGLEQLILFLLSARYGRYIMGNLLGEG